MVNIASIKKENEGVKGLVEKPVGVFVGGTSGIGEYTAYNFARYTEKPIIYIVGRSESAGEKILQKLKELNTNSESHFVKTDVTLINECDQLCDQIKEKEDKVNLLFLSSGFLTTAGRTETTEDNDKKLAVNYYGRWRIVDRLMPLLQQAADNSENTRVVSVLSPGNEGPVEEDDLGLKHKFSLAKANRHIVEFNSLAVAKFGKLYPNISFSHAHPGFVATGIARELPWPIRAATNGFFKTFLATSEEDSAQKFFYLGWAGDKFKAGPHIVDSKLNEMMPNIEKKGFLSPELQEKVWNHTEEVFKSAST